MNRKDVLECTALAGIGGLALTISSAALAQDDSANRVGGLDEIIVTAQKREQRLQDVPVAITALTSESLEANRVKNIGDLSAIAPNISVRETSGGVASPGVTIRGALSYGVGPGADREVGFYVNGVYIGNALGSMFDLADIERIEVLRGPQGTLFGRNATAGAISIVTKDPSGIFGFKQEIGVGNYDQISTKTRLDLPAIGPFSASLSYSHSERRGETRNLGAGMRWDYSAAGRGIRTSPRWLGSQNTESFAAALKFEPSDAINLVYKFDWSEMHGTPLAIGLPGFGPPLDGGLTEMVHALQPDPSILTPITTRRPDAVNNGFTTDTDLKIHGHVLTAIWQPTENVTLKNVMGYRRAKLFTSQELGALGGEVLPDSLSAAFGGLPGGTPLIIYGSITEFRHKQFSDELQLNIDTGPATITAGLLYYWQKQATGGPAGLPNQYFFTPITNITPSGVRVLGCPDPTSCEGPAPTRSVSKAAYIQVEGHLTPQLDLVGGYRITKDDKTAVSPFLTSRVKDTNSSYLIGVNYKPDQDMLIYAKYSTAFMSGGGNTGLFPADFMTYAPEKSYSWEAGLKTDLLDRRLRLNLALFTMKYKDIQFIIGGIQCGDPTAGICVFTAADARAKGIEFEATAAPARGLTLNAGLGYTDFKYLNVSPLATAATGYFLSTYRPKLTSNLSAQYDTPPLFDDSYLSFRLDANYRSTSLLSADPAPAYQSQVRIPGIWLLNARTALANLNVGGHRGEIALWGKNLTNDDHMAFASSFNFIFPTTYERARTYGVDLKFEW